MKRKAVVALVVLLISSAGFYAAGELQKKEANNETAKSEPKIEAKLEANNENKATQEIKKEDNTSQTQVNVDKNETSSAAQGQAKQEEKPQTKSKDNSQAANEVKPIPVKQEKAPEPVEEPNLIITDTISGKVILSKRISFNGESAAKITTAALDAAQINYKTAVFGGAVYFSSINGVRERSAGASSGWCYFVNGKKLAVGSGDYKLNTNDKLEWKFLKDGLSE
jgi:hypothetical protein